MVLCLFAVPAIISVATWYVSRKSQSAATWAYILAVPLFIGIQLAGQWRMANTAASVAQLPQPRLELAHATRDLVDVVLEESATLPPQFVNDSARFNAYIAELIRHERLLGRKLTATEKRAIIADVHGRS
jgi:hypothetical protein